MRTALIALPTLLAALLVCAPPARAAGTYWTTQALLKDFFQSSERVTYEKRRLSASEVDAISTRLGYRPPKAEYVVFIATTKGSVDGYAIIDEEKGQHLPITFGVQFDAAGNVVRQEVLVYREGYGDEIRDPRFRKQFTGKRADDLKHDVVAVAGATISSHAMSVGVRRAAVLLEELVVRPRRTANAGAPNSNG